MMHTIIASQPQSVAKFLIVPKVILLRTICRMLNRICGFDSRCPLQKPSDFAIKFEKIVKDEFLYLVESVTDCHYPSDYIDSKR